MAFNLYQPTSVANVFGKWLFGIDTKFKIILRVGAIVVIWSLWLSRNDKVFNDKKLFSFAGYLHSHMYSPFVVHVTTDGVSRPFYGGFCAIEENDEGYFYPT